MVSNFAKRPKQNPEPESSDSESNNKRENDVSDSSAEEMNLSQKQSKKEDSKTGYSKSGTKGSTNGRNQPRVPLSDDDSDNKSEVSVPVSQRKSSTKQSNSKKQKEESGSESEASETESNYKSSKNKQKRNSTSNNKSVNKSINKSRAHSESSVSEDQDPSPKKKQTKKHRKSNVETSSVSSIESSPAKSSKGGDNVRPKSKANANHTNHSTFDDSTSFIGRKADKKYAGNQTRDEDAEELTDIDRKTMEMANKILSELGGYRMLTDEEKKTKFVTYANKNKLDIYDFMANYSTSKTPTLKSLFVHFNNKLGVYYVAEDGKPKFVYIKNSKQLKNIMRDHKRMYFPVVDFKMQCVFVEEGLFPDILKTYTTVVDQQTSLRKYMWYSSMVNIFKFIQTSMEELKLGKKHISKALKVKKDKPSRTELKPFNEYHRKIVHYIDLFTFRYTGAFALYLEVKAEVERITCKEYSPHLCVLMKDEFQGTKCPVQLGKPERLKKYVI